MKTFPYHAHVFCNSGHVTESILEICNNVMIMKQCQKSATIDVICIGEVQSSLVLKHRHLHRDEETIDGACADHAIQAIVFPLKTSAKKSRL